MPRERIAPLRTEPLEWVQAHPGFAFLLFPCMPMSIHGGFAMCASYFFTGICTSLFLKHGAKMILSVPLSDMSC